MAFERARSGLAPTFCSWQALVLEKDQALHGIVFAVAGPEGGSSGLGASGDECVAEFDTVALCVPEQMSARVSGDCSSDRDTG